MAKPKKLAVIGIDSVSASLIEQMVARGGLPNISRLMKEGCFAQAMSYMPNETGTNWCVIATGAHPMTTGVNMATHLRGDPLDKMVRGFPSDLCKAEQIWTTANRAGKRCVIFDYPQSFPIKIDNVIHVGEDGRPDNAIRALSEVRAYVTRQPEGTDTNPSLARLWSQHGTRVELKPATGWKGIPDASPPVLATELPIQPGNASEVKTVESLYACVWPDANGRYHRVTVHAERDASQAVLDLTPGAFSPWVIHEFNADGEKVTAGLRGKLLKLSPDAADFHLYFSQIYPADGFTTPAHLAAELVRRFGPYTTQPSRQQVVQGGASDVKTYFEEQEYQSAWLANAVEYVLANEDWDLFIMKWHGSDWTNHLCAYMLDPLNPLYDPARADEGWRFWVDVISLGDNIIGKVMEAAGGDAVIAVVSDHGGGYSTPPGGGVNVNGILARHGFIARADSGGTDWTRTKAWAAKHYVWINLKGRDPDGIVSPGAEFEELRRQIIECLLGETDPGTGRHLFKMVCPIEDAVMLGIGGERVGDIFYWEAERPRVKMTRAEFEAKHPDIVLGTWDWPRANSGAHTHDPFILMAGPGLKKSYKSPKIPWLSAFTPTLCHLSGIPAPADADGAVMWDFLAE